MAGAKPGVHVVQLKPISVPQSLQDGAKFIKWDDDSTVGTPVTLRVDKKGFFLYWTDQNKETESLEISSVRDIRTGKHARVPKEGKLKDTVNMGAPDTPLDEKTVTVVYGEDFVNIRFVNFCCNCREIARTWTDSLMSMAYNILALNASATTFLEKAYIKLTLMTDKDNLVPIKNVLKMFAQNKEDKKRVEKALESIGYETGKHKNLDPRTLTFEDFFRFYRNLTGRQEIEKIFDELCGSKKKEGHMTVEQLVEFINQQQRDPRLNEILYPHVTSARAKDLINQYEPNKSLTQKGLLSVDGFLRYLMSDDNAIVAPETLDLNQDMDQPLSHYFINSSHNTYLSGHQLTGKSSVEMYRQCLLAGCRCVELDCWNGKTSEEEPNITHGFTVVTEISFKEVIEAIAESAFKTSPYPVILSFENHCSAKQQAKMAMYCSKILGDALLSEPLSLNPLVPGSPLPSPNQLLRKIIIKNKKKHYHRSVTSDDRKIGASVSSVPGAIAIDPKLEGPRLQKTNSKDSGEEPALNGDDLIPASNGDIVDSDESSGSEDEDILDDDQTSGDREQGTASQESEAGAELSALVNYVQPVRFHGFEAAEKRNRSYEISSFVETAATTLLKDHPEEFVNYNKRQLSRIYPKGTRVDSSNYMPQVYWNAGCQLVALNYQTLDLGMQLNLGIFDYNARTGFLLKPEFMRRDDRKFDPFAESTVDGIIAGYVSVQIISGQFLSDKRVGTYVEVEMYGLPADTFRKRFRTKVVQANGINPVYDEEPIILKKVVLPDLACLRIVVCEESGKMIGHRILPIIGLRPGYRHISLRNESGQPLSLATLFVHIVVKDYVHYQYSELANALVNPIKYQSEREKRDKQLECLLTDDIEEMDESDKSPIVKQPSYAPADLPARNSSSGGCSADLGLENNDPVTSSPKGSVGKRQDLGRSSNSIRSPAQPSGGTSDAFSELIVSTSGISNVSIIPESIDQIKQDSKQVQFILGKLERDLQALRKKREKAVCKMQESKQQKEDKLTQTGEKKSTLAKTHSKLFKKLSKTNVKDSLTKRSSETDSNEVSSEQVSKLQDLQRTHSETLITLHKDFCKSQLELQEKYNEPLHNAIEKAILLSQANQMKMLHDLLESEKAEFRKRLDSLRRDEIKNLKRSPRDKNELSRMKREIYQRYIKQAVNEIQKLQDAYEEKKADLESQHEEVKKKFEEEKSQSVQKLTEEFHRQCEQVPEEYASFVSCDNTASPARDVTSL